MNKETSVPDWMLERYLLGELPAKKRRQLEKRLAQDPALRAKLEKMRSADREILKAYPPEQMIPEILRRAELAKPRPAPARRWRLAWLAAPAMALAVFLLLVLPPLIQKRLAVSELNRPDDYIGMKGDGSYSPAAPELQLYRRSGDGGTRLRDGSPARAGDLLQIALIPGGQTHGVILSIDGAGTATLHFPANMGADTALPGGARIFLPQAYELDQAPLFERFFFISAGSALPTAAILERARALARDRNRAMTGNLDLPGQFRQCSLLIRK